GPAGATGPAGPAGPQGEPGVALDRIRAATLHWYGIRQPASVLEDLAVRDVVFDGSDLWVAGSSGLIQIPPGSSGGRRTANNVALRPPLAYDGKNVWGNNPGNNLLRYDPGTNELASVAVNAAPRSLAFDGRYLWAANYGANLVQRIDTDSLAVVSSSPLAHPTALAFDGAYLWVTNDQGVLAKLNANGAVVASYQVGLDVQQIAFDGANLWVPSADVIHVLAVADGAEVATLPGLGVPTRLVFDGSHMWATGATGAAGRRYLVSDFTYQAFTPPGHAHVSAFDGNFVWLVDDQVGDVYKM
ncbi:MAG TPA: hypothetical protein VHE35_04385, partial [Kofleriaceae bacterium]|nr:hypothetical protein [Kofleriaceae bacterium]